MITKKYLDDLSYNVLGAAIEVHKAFGRGLMESVYHSALKVELTHRKINFLTELKVPVNYKDQTLNLNFRCDLLIEKCLIVELKASNIPLFNCQAQLLNYMSLLKVPKGMLINFNCNNVFRERQKTLVNDLFRSLPNG